MKRPRVEFSAECSVYCSGAPPGTAVSDPADLEEAIGAVYGIADALDDNRLVPIGCTGELLLEGLPWLAAIYTMERRRQTRSSTSLRRREVIP